MDVSAQTLREVQFREKLRGYHPDDVDEFLERVAAGIEYLQDRLRQAVERAQRAEQRVAESNDGDDALRRTLVLAQRTAELAVQEAREEADRIGVSAQANARAIVHQAEEVARRAIEESQGSIRAEVSQLELARDALRGDIAALERHLDDERIRLHSSLTTLLQVVGDHMVAPASPAVADVDVPPARQPSFELPAETLVWPLDPNAPAPFAAGDEMQVEAPAEPASGDTRWAAFSPDVARAGAPAPFDDAGPASAGEETGDDLGDAQLEPAAASDAAAPSAVLDDDPFIAELRRAITDTEPLGPRDDDDALDGLPTGSDELRDGDLLDAGRLGSLLRRRR